MENKILKSETRGTFTVKGALHLLIGLKVCCAQNTVRGLEMFFNKSKKDPTDQETLSLERKKENVDNLQLKTLSQKL